LVPAFGKNGTERRQEVEVLNRGHESDARWKTGRTNQVGKGFHIPPGFAHLHKVRRERKRDVGNRRVTQDHDSIGPCRFIGRGKIARPEAGAGQQRRRGPALGANTGEKFLGIANQTCRHLNNELAVTGGAQALE
jgi:hypothetical protein